MLINRRQREKCSSKYVLFNVQHIVVIIQLPDTFSDNNENSPMMNKWSGMILIQKIRQS